MEDFGSLEVTWLGSGAVAVGEDLNLGVSPGVFISEVTNCPQGWLAWVTVLTLTCSGMPWHCVNLWRSKLLDSFIGK